MCDFAYLFYVLIASVLIKHIIRLAVVYFYIEISKKVTSMLINKLKKKGVVMHSQGAYKCRIPTNEAISAMKDVSSGAFKLLIYYYSKSTGWAFDDTEIADTIGVTERRLKELKKELIDKDYLYISKGADIDNYFIGRQAVQGWKNPPEDPIDE